jgi:DUF971 family protein
MDDRVGVKDITVERDKGVTIVFGDDHVGSYDLVELRVHCPCAGCRGDRERGITPWPKATSPLPLAVEGAELVGAWGISFTWNDQHRAGIYPFTSLRQWSDDGEPPLNPDSGLRA